MRKLDIRDAWLAALGALGGILVGLEVRPWPLALAVAPAAGVAIGALVELAFPGDG